ncbi:hypothetical protein Runsl_5343 [Runella slithyformis DSM 19594]|uniref:Uncharacterized protein n=1 Tax=Runella slithyformis (strain ATCC 29530 / DSM 19594 / LMG 11500 / NCIMB 11436 / LSU 4) TaxID=761193 RepID=A0A7U3ZQQ6_RUNSL|nr:hypothetical protein Runsl_5343 [Runella slithyformis DSM 19594]
MILGKAPSSLPFCKKAVNISNVQGPDSERLEYIK